jgi:hypothetical protein
VTVCWHQLIKPEYFVLNTSDENNTFAMKVALTTVACRTHFFIVAALSLGTAGCGIMTPAMTISSDPQASANLVLAIVGHVESELGCAICDIIEFDKLNAAKPSDRAYPWLDSAITKMSLKLTADEKTNLNPGTLVTQPFANAITTFTGKAAVSSAQSFTFAVNAGVSSEATRIDNSDYSFSVKDVFLNDHDYDPKKGIHCTTPYVGILTDSDLHIKDWLDSRLRAYVIHPEIKRTAPQTLTTEITFIVAGSGNITPTWKLIPTSFNTAGSSFFGLGRTQTDDIIITISVTDALATTAQNIAKTTSGFSTALNGLTPGR